MVSPLACGVEETWSRLLAGKSGARAIDPLQGRRPAPAASPAKYPAAMGATATFNPDQWVDPQEQRRVDDFIIYGLTAAQQAVWTDPGYVPQNRG